MPVFASLAPHYIKSTNMESTALAPYPDQGGEERGVCSGPGDRSRPSRVTSDSFHLEIVAARTDRPSNINLEGVKIR